VQIEREIRIAIARMNRVDVPIEQLARRGEVGGLVRTAARIKTVTDRIRCMKSV
jgi:hypothetical protein